MSAIDNAILALRDDPSLRLLGPHELRTEVRLALMAADGDPDDPAAIAAIVAAISDPGAPAPVGNGYAAVIDHGGRERVFLRPSLADDTPPDDDAAPDTVRIEPPAPEPEVLEPVADPSLWRAWKRATSLSDAEAAKVLGIARSTFSSWCAGERNTRLTRAEVERALETLELKGLEVSRAQEAARASLRALL